MLTVFSDVLGICGGWFIAVKSLGVPDGPYWEYSRLGVDTGRSSRGWSRAFSSARRSALISCYKGFTCGAGASGVGRACTESFVASFIAIIVFNFFFAQVAKEWYIALLSAMAACADGSVEV